MADNAFKANKNKDNKPKFDTNKLKILGNNLLKQLEKSNNELQNTNPIVNYDKIKASLDSNDINRQRDAITAIQYLLNNTASAEVLNLYSLKKEAYTKLKTTPSCSTLAFL